MIPEALRKALEQGDLPFGRFMELALYAPGEGYYGRAANPVGKGADYVTSVQISPAFSWALARLADQFVERAGDDVCGIGDIGCGDGTLIRGIREAMTPALSERCRFFGVDRSLSRVEPRAGEAITWDTSVAALPRDLPMLVFSNELFDAFPFARVVMLENGLRELMVRLAEGELEWSDRPAPGELLRYFQERDIALQEGQYADVSLDWGRFYGDLCAQIARGMIVTIDYGFPAERLFDPRVRRYGTAVAFSGQLFNRDLLARPSEQDLTAHINFSDLEHVGHLYRLTTATLTRQASFLLSLGIAGHPLFQPVDESAETSLSEAVEEAEERQLARRLILPVGIGEEMRVLVQLRGIPEDGWLFQRRLGEF